MNLYSTSMSTDFRGAGQTVSDAKQIELGLNVWRKRNILKLLATDYLAKGKKKATRTLHYKHQCYIMQHLQ